MRKFFIFAVVVMISAMGAKAQSDEVRNEIGVSYGLPVSLIGDGIGHAIGTGIFDAIEGRKWTNDKQFGSLGVEYFRHLDNPRVAVGGIVTYAQYGEDVEYKGEKVGERTRKYISVMPSAKYYYVDKKHFGVYSKVGLGVMLFNSKEEDIKNGKSESESKIYAAYQISALGLEAGSKNIRAFMEAGVGEQGIFLFGLRCKF